LFVWAAVTAIRRRFQCHFYPAMEDRAVYAQIGVLSSAMVSKEPTHDGLDKLYGFCRDQKLPVEIRKNAILSALQVLVSVLPDYTVGKHSAKDNVSRDVRERRSREKLVLDFTRRFIQFCELMAFGRNNNIRIRVACGRALCAIFEKKRRFNTGEMLAKTVVRLGCAPVPLLRKHAAEALVRVFQSDPSGDDALRVISRVAETPTPKISAEILSALNSIELKPIKESKEKPIEDKALQRELRDAGVVDRSLELRHNQSAILEHLFGTVFRFLKETKSEEHFCEAMRIVKSFVAHINIDVVPSIIDALRQRRFSLRASIIAANTALSVCESARLVVDLRGFYASVYARAYEALEAREVLLEFLTLFENVARQLDTARTAAFAKRMVMMALQATADVQGVILACVRQMLCDDVSLTRAVDFEFEAAGEFNVALDDPDACNGPAAKLWELAHLANSHNRFVSEIAREVARLTDLEAVRNASIAAAMAKRDWSPAAVAARLDDRMRVFDVALFDGPAGPAPKSLKLFEFGGAGN